MSRVEEKVFTDKLEALRYNREHSVQFFEAAVPAVEFEGPETVYVVAVSLHRAQMALVAYLMDITKWTKKEQDEAYIEALESESEKNKAEADKKKQDVDLP